MKTTFFPTFFSTFFSRSYTINGATTFDKNRDETIRKKVKNSGFFGFFRIFSDFFGTGWTTFGQLWTTFGQLYRNISI
jgi:hypothetical protein